MIDVFGTKEVIAAINKIKVDNIKDGDVLLAKMSFVTQGNAIKSIQTTTPTGRTYKRRSVVHQASSAGEFPKTDTGQLVRNIIVSKDGILNYSVGSRRGAPHGLWLEYGTRNMSPRPWLKPTFDDTIIKFRGEFDG